MEKSCDCRKACGMGGDNEGDRTTEALPPRSALPPLPPSPCAAAAAAAIAYAASRTGRAAETTSPLGLVGSALPDPMCVTCRKSVGVEMSFLVNRFDSLDFVRRPRLKRRGPE